MLVRKSSAQKFINRVAAKHSSELRRPEQSYSVDPTNVVFQTDWISVQNLNICITKFRDVTEAAAAFLLPPSALHEMLRWRGH